MTAVANGAAALAALAKDRPDLVLTDMMMPVMDGIGLLRRLRADPALRDIPVILLSARAGEEARIEGLRTGADDYLTKPFSARELLARVASSIELARGRAQTASILRDEAHRLEILNRTAGVLAAEMELEPLVQSVTDAATELTGAGFGAFFYNVTDGQRRILPALYVVGSLARDVREFSRCRATPPSSRRPSAARGSSGPATSARTRATAEHAEQGPAAGPSAGGQLSRGPGRPFLAGR